MKVFGIGLGKTGTTTLEVVLRKLGYDVKGPDPHLTKQMRKGNWKPILQTAEKYDGFQDFPWPLTYKKMDERYENSKFILTLRKNKDVWFDSLKKHANRMGPTEHRKMVFGYRMPHGSKKDHISFYKNHNEEVRKYFGGRENDLLEVCWEKGSGWREICNFLGHDVPNEPFPYANESPSRAERYMFNLKSKAKEIVRTVLQQ